MQLRSQLPYQLVLDDLLFLYDTLLSTDNILHPLQLCHDKFSLSLSLLGLPFANLPLMLDPFLKPYILRLQLYDLIHIPLISLSVCGVKSGSSGCVLGGDCMQLGTHEVKFGVETL